MLLNLWFWATPIVYHLEILPEGAKTLIGWNPLTPLFRAYQEIVLRNAWPEWGELLFPLAVAALFLALGLFSFRRLSGEMVDEL